MASFISKEATERRWDSIRAQLEEGGYDALAVLNPENTYYVSGWHLDVAPWERPVATIIPVDGAPFMILHELSTNHVRMAQERGTIHIAERVFYKEHPSTLYRAWTRLQWGELVKAQLESHGLGRACIAVDGPLGPLSEVPLAASDDLSFHPEPLILKNMRRQKDEEELALFREAAALTDFGQEVFKSLVKPGAYTGDVDLETARRMRVEGAKRYPGSSLQARCSSLTGAASASPHGTGAGSDMQYQRGDGIVNIVVVTLNDYSVENERTWIVGEASDAQRKAFECIGRAQAAALAKCVSGSPVWAIDAAAQSIIEAGGYGEFINHRSGHGIGLLGHGWPEDMAFNRRALLPREVYTIEPGFYIYGLGGFRQDDTVVVGDTPEVLTTTPKDLANQTIPV